MAEEVGCDDWEMNRMNRMNRMNVYAVFGNSLAAVAVASMLLLLLLLLLLLSDSQPAGGEAPTTDRLGTNRPNQWSRVVFDARSSQSPELSHWYIH